ncbi:MAG: type III secretion system cytoplasmic ring protein SctQ [Chlamydiales bacterium]|nr:type III secretion system cytoplasmic ring protein SctQ [Chlamydiales bacterium]
MTETAARSLDWIKQIPTSLLSLDAAPALGYPPEFPWKEFSYSLSQVLEIEEIKVSPKTIEWRTKEQLFEGIPNHTYLQLAISGVEGTFFWVVSEEDLNTVISTLINDQAAILNSIDAEFRAGFFHFLAMEVINIARSVDFDSSLAVQLVHDHTPPQEAALCLDIETQIGSSKLLSRLLLSQTFRNSWVQRYEQNGPDSILQSPLADTIEAIVHIEIGKTTLPQSTWQGVKTGDFVILDACSYDLDKQKGHVLLTMKGHPLFRGKLKQNEIKILEFPQYREADTMTDINNPEEEFEDFEDQPFEEDMEEFEDEDFDLEGDEEDVEASEYEQTEAAPSASQQRTSEPTTATAPSAQEMINPEEFPLTINVEIGRLQVTLKKLMELQPGNMIELSARPEDGVDLIVNGKRIARGELLRIGDTLGVRITEKS